jgi:NDP-sugar pyrophosphorylase family protein
MSGPAGNPNIVILAGGVSSRMKQESGVHGGIHPQLQREALEKPKSMIGVGNKGRPFLDYLLLTAQQAGYRDVCIVVGERDATLRRYYDGGGAAQFPSLAISYAIQSIPAGREKPLGTADALLTALRVMDGWHDQTFTVCNSDNLYSVHVCTLLRSCGFANALIDYDRAGLQFDEKRIYQFAVIQKDTAGYVRDIIEKPSEQQLRDVTDATGRIGVSMNIFRLSYNEILPYLETIPLHAVRGEKELPLAVRQMVRDHPDAMMSIPVKEHVIDLTSQSDIPAVQRYLTENFPDTCFQQSSRDGSPKKPG